MKKTINLGAIDLSFHKVAAAVFELILNHWGYEVKGSYHPHEKMFELQKTGEVDLLISAWLPGSHSLYLQSYHNEVIQLNPIYEPYCIWGIPDYLAEKGIEYIDDLRNPDTAGFMEKEINGIGMGAGISRFSIEIIEKYGLKESGFYFISNYPDDFYRIVEKKFLNKENFVIPLWYPQFLHHSLPIVPLKDPKHLLRGQDKAIPLLRKDSSLLFSEKEIHILSAVYLGNEAVSAMDYSFNREGLTAIQSSLSWITTRYGGLEKYLSHLESQIG
ncbi:glycine betaine/proline transport system substrate-binding protein [Chryseobacterium sp. 52]|uniref:glycine betaine ABC transporter substrate-binding protein n=1 Tax=Chryseobacterium sp. 52 TaxID=2035213 RepID=UPI000C1A3E96|nr:glycine betaine ABC transporter substrate-binding protein [Chryseobacterium sp. 52]PIF43271.1 glycine betaine/proline transport system substrate-binding protein [Chryseobacterium sp. 52]